MPGRQSHGNAPSKKPKVRAKANKSSKRALDAFSIASHENPEKFRVKQHRLGQQEGGNRPNKRRRNEDDDEDGEEDEEEQSQSKKRKGPAKGRFDELDVEEGSDSEGNEWKLGQVDSDDDSDLDSDEAFGESDEERFEGFAFSGSADAKSKKKKVKVMKEVNLDEDEVESEDSELEEGDLGEGAVDLATMLDMADDEEDDEEEDEDMNSADDDEAGNEESDDQSSASSADEEDENEDDDAQNPEKLAAISRMVASLPVAKPKRAVKERNTGMGEETKPGAYFLPPISSNGREFGLGLIGDDSKTSQLLGSIAPTKKKSQKQLEIPLAKRQLDCLDRSAAYDKTKETLDRWTDTVKHNRRAEHLMFPLPDNEAISAKNNKQLVPTNLSKPFNELEATIQSILEESGLATADGKDDEDHIREFEELETNKLSIEEVKARRDQLRMARDLLFREEVKAKRIKKIKSKSYRKVHRKQREKEERLNQEALAEGGFEPSEDEVEAQDKRRAEERMGSRHRGSKWAKAIKGTGRAAWDDEARDGVTEMAKRDEELRKRVEGRSIRKDHEGSEDSFDDSDGEDDDDDDATGQQRLLQRLGGIGDDRLFDPSLPGARLANMDFMRKADAARKKRNDTTVEEMRRELAGEESESEKEALEVGRRTFGPGTDAAKEKRENPFKLNEFEEAAASNEDEVEFQGLGNSSSVPTTSRKHVTKIQKAPVQEVVQFVAQTKGGAWSKVTTKSSTVSEAEAKRRRQKKNDAIEIEGLDLSKAAMIATQPKSNKLSKKISNVEGSEDDESDDNLHLPFAVKDQELIKRAFAGADVVGEFEAEKKQTAEDEDDKVVDNTLPGWGAWVGDGVSKKDKARNKGRFLTTIEGVKAKNRKDAKLEKVIINEKKVKKNGKYLASTLPHPFETKMQYERSLRLPIGPEWTTKETFQDATKPRILLKQGVIAPMSKPLL